MLEALLGGVVKKTNLVKLPGAIPVTASFISSAAPVGVSSVLLDNVLYLMPFNKNALSNQVYKLNTTNMTLTPYGGGTSNGSCSVIYPFKGKVGYRSLNGGNASYRVMNADGSMSTNGGLTSMICIGTYPVYGEPLIVGNGSGFYGINITISSTSGTQGYVTRYTFSGSTFDASATFVSTAGMAPGGPPLGLYSWLYGDRYVYTVFGDGTFTRYDATTNTFSQLTKMPTPFISQINTSMGMRSAVIGTKLYLYTNFDHTVWCYDISKSTWVAEAVLTDLNGYKSMANIMNGPDGKLIIHPGTDSNYNYSTDLFVYTPAA